MSASAPAIPSPTGQSALVRRLRLALAFWSIYQRRTLCMPVNEAVQLLLGLITPVFLVGHVQGTHVANRLYGFQDSYTFLMLVAWVHGCIGMHFWLRMQPWYSRRPLIPYTLALLVPPCALFGFVQGGREVAVIPLIQSVLDPAQTVAQPERISGEEREISVPNRDAPIATRIIAEVESLVLDTSAARPA